MSNMKFEVKLLPNSEEENEYSTPCYFHFEDYQKLTEFIQIVSEFGDDISINLFFTNEEVSDLSLDAWDELEDIKEDLKRGHKLAVTSGGIGGYDISEEVNNYLVNLILGAV